MAYQADNHAICLYDESILALIPRPGMMIVGSRHPVKSLYGLNDAILGDDYQLRLLVFVEIWPALTRLFLLEDAVCRGYLYGTFHITVSTLLRALAGI